MTNLLFPLILLACPLMMIFMMRGMHGAQDDAKVGHDPHAGHWPGPAPDDVTADERIALLEREVASLRASQRGPQLGPRP